jgi:hypothetical protein
MIADGIIVAEMIDVGQEALEEIVGQDQGLDHQGTLVAEMIEVAEETVETVGMIEEMVIAIVITKETDVTLLTKEETIAEAQFVIQSRILTTIKRSLQSRIKIYKRLQTMREMIDH